MFGLEGLVATPLVPFAVTHLHCIGRQLAVNTLTFMYIHIYIYIYIYII